MLFSSIWTPLAHPLLTSLFFAGKTGTRSSIKASHDTPHPMPRVYHLHLCYTNQNISLSPNFGFRNLIQTKQMMQIGHPKIVSLNGSNSLVGGQSSNESALASANRPHDGHLCRTTSSATLFVLQGLKPSLEDENLRSLLPPRRNGPCINLPASLCRRPGIR